MLNPKLAGRAALGAAMAGTFAFTQCDNVGGAKPAPVPPVEEPYFVSLNDIQYWFVQASTNPDDGLVQTGEFVTLSKSALTTRQSSVITGSDPPAIVHTSSPWDFTESLDDIYTLSFGLSAAAVAYILDYASRGALTRGVVEMHNNDLVGGSGFWFLWDSSNTLGAPKPEEIPLVAGSNVLGFDASSPSFGILWEQSTPVDLIKLTVLWDRIAPAISPSLVDAVEWKNIDYAGFVPS